jgi:hypothetical protein
VGLDLKQPQLKNLEQAHRACANNERIGLNAIKFRSERHQLL